MGINQAQAGSGGTSAIAVTALGNLGATSAMALNPSNEVWFTGTLTADHVATITLAAGGRATYYLTQDGTGGRTFSVNDGTTTTLVPVQTPAGDVSIVRITSPDTSTLQVTA